MKCEKDFLKMKIEQAMNLYRTTNNEKIKSNCLESLEECIVNMKQLEEEEIRVPYCPMCNKRSIKIYEQYNDTFECKNCGYVFTMKIEYSGKEVLEMQDITETCINELNGIVNGCDSFTANGIALNCIHYLLHTMLPILQKDIDNKT